MEQIAIQGLQIGLNRNVGSLLAVDVLKLAQNHSVLISLA